MPGKPAELTVEDAISQALPNSDGQELVNFYTIIKNMSQPMASPFIRTLVANSAGDICAALKIGKARFYRLLDRLWALGLIEVEKEKLEHGWRNRYFLYTKVPYEGPVRVIRQGSFRQPKGSNRLNLKKKEGHPHVSDRKEEQSSHRFWDVVDVFECGLSMPAILVRLYLTSRADLKDEATPSLREIASHCSMSLQTAERALKELEYTGWIVKRYRYLPNGARLSNAYKLLVPYKRLEERWSKRNSNLTNGENYA